MALFKSLCRLSMLFAIISVVGTAHAANTENTKTIENADKSGKATNPTPPTKVPPTKTPAPKKKRPVFQVPPSPPKTKLLLPIVFHLSDSQLWKDSQSLKPVLAEMQRIFDQASIVLDPTFVTKGGETKHIDVVFLTKIGNKGRGPNGLSYNRRTRVLVNDNVYLRRLKDQRPTNAIPVPASFPDAKPGETIKVNIEQAEQARTTAHEVGHQLRLPHRQDYYNLMASGTTGWTFNQKEIDRIRTAAVEKFGAKEVE